MDTTTRAGRIAVAHRLSEALRRAPGDIPPGDSEGRPIGDCGRSTDSPCGMVDRSECKTHADVPDGDPETMAFAGTLQQRKRQLKTARRYGLR
jgi:hypothetical protein